MSLGKMSLSFSLASMHISVSESFTPEFSCINIALLINGSVPQGEVRSEASESKLGLLESESSGLTAIHTDRICPDGFLSECLAVTVKLP